MRHPVRHPVRHPSAAAALGTPVWPQTLLEELATRPHRTLGLPQRGTAIVAERVERADVGEGHDFVAAQASTRNEIVE